MTLKKKYIGSFIYIKNLGREVEICEENEVTLINNNLKYLFSDNIKPSKPKHSKRRATTRTDKS